MSTINHRQSTLTAIPAKSKNDRHSGKKAKLEDTRNNMVKPNKRAALGNITNNVNATRRQPSRAVKQVYCKNVHIHYFALKTVLLD